MSRIWCPSLLAAGLVWDIPRAMLPTFFVIGAAKAGTTSLHHYLGRHPEIYVPAEKEPAFFCRAEDGPWPFGRIDSRAQYEALFPADVPMRGDCTPAYSHHPWRPGVPERIHELVPDARFIYLVRDPVERVLAQAQQMQSIGLANKEDVAAALRDLDDPVRNRYLIPSLYATQVERYLEVFPAERMLVVDSDELKSERTSALRRIFHFLGVDDSFTSESFSEQLNPGDQKRLPSRRYASLRRSGLGKLWRRLPERARVPVGHRVMRTLTSPAERPNLDEEGRRALEEVFGPEVARLRALTGLTFSSWSL